MFSLNSKIVIFGGSGLIGRAVLKCLTEARYLNVLTPEHTDLDLENPVEVRNFFRINRPEVVILAAGTVGGILENQNKPVNLIITNLNIQLNIAKYAHEFAAQKVVLIGSSCMYPKDCTQPMKEIYLGTGLLEKSSLSYAISKIAGLQIGFAYNLELSDTKFLCVIPNSAYGPGDSFDPLSGHVLSSLIYKFHKAKQLGESYVSLWGSGRPRREFVYSEDIADAIIFLLKKNYATLSEPINIGSGKDISILDLAELIAQEVGFDGRITWEKDKPDGAMQKLLDNEKISKLGWFPRTKLKKGIATTYSWYKQTIGFID
jgi:GDP-L-fucose synthase